MTNQQITPLLIVAQSGRFLTQSASQTYDKVWVTDYFGDVDTRLASEQWHLLPDLETISQSSLKQHISTITEKAHCHLVYGSGIEYCPSLTSSLPSNVKLYGNSSVTLNLIQKPDNFFGLLNKLNLSFPETRFEPPSDKSGWLFKPAAGLGGEKIQQANDTHANLNGYFQRIEAGITGSVLFLANGTRTKIIGINRQWASARGSTPFRLTAIKGHFQIDQKHYQQLKQSINAITAQAKLVGLNSLDFIISKKQQIKLLEINPRPSASCELYETHRPIIQLHIDACQGKLPERPLKNSNKTSVLNYLYAPQTITIPPNIRWHEQCHDLPPAHTTINKGEPICTLITPSNISDSHLPAQQELKQNIFAQLYKNA